MGNTLIVWFETTYGLGFLKNTLAAFHLGYCKTRRGTRINRKDVDQQELEDAFGTPRGRPFPFDRVYVLHVSEEVLHQISSPKVKGHANFHDSEIERGYTTRKLDEQWQVVYEANLTLSEELGYIQKHFPDDLDTMTRQLWRRIHSYPFSDQWHWLTNISNLRTWLDQVELEKVDLTLMGKVPIRHLSNLREIAAAQANWLANIQKTQDRERYFVNVSMGNKELHTAWYLLNERGYLPRDTTFFQAIFKKAFYPHRYKTFRFYPIDFLEVDKDLFQTLPTPRMYERSRSQKRIAVDLMLKEYLKLGFSILLFGPRGIGKTKLMEEYGSKKAFSVSCELLNDPAYFQEKFIGKKGSPGILKGANGGILFLDDLHLLSQTRQLELLPLLATNQNNRLKNYLDGTTKIQLTAATNLSIHELRSALHPDFYDRIAQLLLEIPSLAEAPEDRLADWRAIWRQLQFPGECPQSPELLRWLRTLALPGNFRDLQRIAISYQAWMNFPAELRKHFPGIKTALEFAQQELKKQAVQLPPKQAYPFEAHTPLAEMKTNFHQALADWAHQAFGSDQKAAAHFHDLDPTEKINRSLLYKWRNGKYSSK